MTSSFLNILRCSIGIAYLGYLGMFVPGISVQYINPPVFCTIPSSVSISVVSQQLRFTLNNLQPATSDSVSRYACVLPLRYIPLLLYEALATALKLTKLAFWLTWGLSEDTEIDDDENPGLFTFHVEAENTGCFSETIPDIDSTVARVISDKQFAEIRIHFLLETRSKRLRIACIAWLVAWVVEMRCLQSKWGH